MPQWAARRSSRAWRHLYKLRAYIKGREEFLEDNPFCVWRKRAGKLTPSNTINHIKPHRGDKKLFLDRSNWETVCTHCHNGACKQQDAGRPVRGSDVSGMPIDPNHHWHRESEGRMGDK